MTRPGKCGPPASGGWLPPGGCFRRGCAPHFLFETSKRKCAAPGGKEKNVRRVGLRQRRPPAAGGGWLALPCRSQGRKRPTLGETFGPGKFGIHPAPLFAAAGRLLMKAAAWANTTAPTPAGGARSEAERAEREAGQMRPCTPLTSAPRRGNPLSKSLRHPPRPSESHRESAGTISRRPPSRSGTLRSKAFFLFGPCTARFSFGKTKREMGGALPSWQPAESPGRLITAPTTS